MPRVPPAYIRDVKQSYMQRLWERRDFARYLAWGNIRSANSNTALGLVWLVLNPLLLAMVYLVIFGVVLRASRGEPDYMAYLLVGMFGYYYTRQSVSAGSTSITRNVRLLSNLNIPKLVMPISAVIQAIVGFVLSIVVVVVINALYSDIYLTWQALYLIPAFLIHTVFNLGMATLFARWAVSIADLTNILPYMLRIWLYFSPIIWPMSFFDEAPHKLQLVLQANPMFAFIGMYRSALLDYPIETFHVVSASIWAVAAVSVGLVVFIRSETTMLRGL